MISIFNSLRNRLVVKIITPIAFILFVSIFLLSYSHLEHQQEIARENLILGVDRVANTVKLGLQYAMMLNSRDDIFAIVKNYSKLHEMRDVRILNKTGEVMFATDAAQVGQRVPMADPMCQVCHASFTPKLQVPLSRAIYREGLEKGEHILRLVSPIHNEVSCSAASSCHFHQPEEKVLGYLDLAFSRTETDWMIGDYRDHTISLAAVQFLLTFATLSGLLVLLIKRPIAHIMRDADRISRGDTPPAPKIISRDEIGRLAEAVHKMGSDLMAKNNQLMLQRNLYQNLFEGVPCIITVQNRDFRLLSFNRTFSEKFNARVGEFCFRAYKGRDEKCPDCPVEKTFKTGQMQSTEESGCYRDGSRADWIVYTAPVYDQSGAMVAAMEMCLDITDRKKLEYSLKRSEKKYMDIFNNIPGAVFVLDRDDFSILDLNRNALVLYGWEKSELTDMTFLDLFADPQKEGFIKTIAKGGNIAQAKHVTKDGQTFFVSIDSSPSEFFNRRVFLVTVLDITKRLETEQQLIQASKMATLGEMATGVAHEINQPLSAIRTSVDLIKRQLSRGVSPDAALLTKVSGLIGEQVERAAKIIGHMREFGRRSDLNLEDVNLNGLLRRTFDFFGEQLSLRNIAVFWELEENLPMVRCEANRMEQVFINFLINARDAIEERAAKSDAPVPRRITIKTMSNHHGVTVRIADTGVGVPENLKAKIFEPFFTTKQVGKGTGLGLSISYGIVKDCGGSIHVVRNEDGGASFFIRLPVAGGSLEPDETA